MKVAIIGGGASGLTAIKSCLDEQLEPVCYERTKEIGGLWNYKEDVSEGQACVFKSTVINSSKEMSSFSDFLVPDNFPIFMHNRYVHQYFKLYAEHFGLIKYIKFQTEILSVKKADDYDKTGRWSVTVKDKVTGKTETIIYDAVMICTGHHAEVNKPDFPGLNKFKGQVVHSHDYRNPKGYDDKRVVIIGIGNSGGDLAVELSHVASQVYLSTRRGTWVLNRISDKGFPVDMLNINRVASAVAQAVPSLVNNILKSKVNNKFDHKMYALQPNYPPLSQHPMVNDELPNKIVSGAVVIKSNVAEFTENDVTFDDGSVEKDIDVVCLATGYIFGFPFVDKSVIEVKENRVDLYKYMFAPDLDHQTLAVIGLVQPYGSIIPIAELQCRLATRVFKGAAKLPTRDEMWADIQAKKDAMSARYVHTQRHTIQVDFIPFMDELATLNGCKPDIMQMLARYIHTQRHTIQVDFIPFMDELASLNGCKPDIKKLFLTDPALALTCLFGPATPFQYRLHGPGAWPGARKAIMTQWNRVVAPFKTRSLGFEEKSSPFGFAMFFVIFVAIYLFFINMFL